MDKIELLKKYKELFDNGIITQEEFNEKKKELLENLETDVEDEDKTVSEDIVTVEDGMQEEYVDNNDQVYSELDQPEQQRSSEQQSEANSSEVNNESNQNVDEQGIVESVAVATTKETVAQKAKKMKKPIIIGAAAVILTIIICIVISGSTPKATSIEASYDGYTDAGTVINSDSPFTVTATFEDGSTQEVTDWTVEETTLHCGHNYIDVNYQDVQTTISIYSPLISEGQYVASVDEINATIDQYATKYLDNYTELSKDTEIGGKYTFNGVGFDSSISYTKKSGNENVAVEGDQIPDTVIYTSILGSDDIESYTDDTLESASVVFLAVDPEANEDESRAQIKEAINEAMENVKSDGMGESTTKLDNLKLYTSVFFMGKSSMIIFSFQEL